MKLLPVLFLAGCALDEPSFSQTEQAAKKQPGDCPSYGCGTNSSSAENRYLTEIHERGEKTPEGMRLIAFGQRVDNIWRQFRPDVIDGALVARDLVTNAIVVPVHQIGGAMFTIEDTVTLDHYYITVVRAETTPMWANAPLANVTTWQYELVYTSTKTPERRTLCTRPPDTDRMNPQMSVLFDDDRINPEDLEVYSEDPDWFTIGCAGSALAKEHLSGNTKAGSKILGRKTTLAERTAFLKMMTADYCGMGHAYTVNGTNLHYRDVYGHLSMVKVGEAVEGLWGEDGAICVGTPRLEFSPSKLSTETFGDAISDDLAMFGCSLPRPCEVRDYIGLKHDFVGGYVLSTNYQ